MKYRPLMLIILPIVLLFFLNVVETKFPWEDNLEVAAGNNDGKSSSEEFSTENSEFIKLKREIPDNYIRMKLVIGKTGNLKGGKEPVYMEPDINSDVAGSLEFNCAVVAKKEQSKRYSDEWVYVDLLGAGEGYVQKKAVTVVDVAFGSEDSFYHEIIKTALKYMGSPFTMGGDSLTEGIDCSHFAAKMYKMNDLSIPDKPLEQREEGILINPEDRQPGDIIFYDKANGGTGHVGIYLGDGYVDNPDDFDGGFIINSTGHSGKKYPEGGVRIVCLKYPDRDHYEVVRFLQEKEAGGADE